jgi:YegS/Rv2252/BmrU family lipid kinase
MGERVPDAIRDALLIFNPTAGRARELRRGALERARKVLARQGIESELARTAGPGMAPELARRAVRERRQMVIVCGGDGTLNEVVNGLAGSAIPLALLPAGTANVFAKELGLPWNIERAAELIGDSQRRRIALGHVTAAGLADGGRYFLSLAGAGPDGAIVRSVSQNLKDRMGTVAFWLEGFRQLASYGFPRFRVMLPNESSEATLIIAGRTKHYGGPLQITTRADLYGNDFELMLCGTNSRWKYLSYMPLLLAGRLRHARDIRFLRAAEMRCEPIDSEPVWVQVDGEPAGRLPAGFRIVSDALTLAVPEKSPQKSED